MTRDALSRDRFLLTDDPPEVPKLPECADCHFRHAPGAPCIRPRVLGPGVFGEPPPPKVRGSNRTSRGAFSMSADGYGKRLTWCAACRLWRRGRCIQCRGRKK